MHHLSNKPNVGGTARGGHVPGGGSGGISPSIMIAPKHGSNRIASRPMSSRLVPSSNLHEPNVSYVTVHSLHDIYSSTKTREKSNTVYQQHSPSPSSGLHPNSANNSSAYQQGPLTGAKGSSWTAESPQPQTVSGPYSKQSVHKSVADRVNYVQQHSPIINSPIQLGENVDLRNPALPNGPRAFNKMGPSIVGANSGGSLRGISLGERRNTAQNMLPSGGLTSVFSDNSGNSAAVEAAMGSGLAVHDPAGDSGVQQDDSAALGYRNTTHINPGDRVIITESADNPGVPYIYRTPEERSYNLQRLNLDKRKLEKVPILQDEEELRLLNFQHNYIVKLERLEIFRKLVFIDLYNNRIEDIEGLEELRGLRVLMLGKNRIRNIANLHTLHKLDVLDLHGNFISEIENLNHLAELRVLNLAGNQIVVVNNLAGLDSLAELNLRRNNITHVKEVDRLPVLQRLFLSFNKIQSLSHIESLTGSQSLLEVTLDNNPVADPVGVSSAMGTGGGDQGTTNTPSSRTPNSSSVNAPGNVSYRQRVICQIANLRQLDMKRITDEERRSALMAVRKEEEKKKELLRSQAMKEKKRAAIANAAKQWDELMRQHQQLSEHNSSTLASSGPSSHDSSRRATMGGRSSRNSGSGGSNKLPALDLNSSTQQGTAGGSSSRAESARSKCSNADERTTGTTDSSNYTEHRWSGSDRQPAGSSALGSSGATPSSSGECDISNCHLADLDGEVLNLYGSGAIPALDRNWGVQAAGHVTTISFKFIDFDHISPHFPKIRARFPNVHTLIFDETNLRQLRQLNALSQLRKLEQLNVKSCGNPLVSNMKLWRLYVLYRLSHFNIRVINDVPVSTEEIVEAEKMFGELMNMASSCAIPAANITTTPRANSADVKKRNPLTSSDTDMKRVTISGTVSSRGGFSNPLQFVSEEKKVLMDNDLVCAKSVATKTVTGLMRDALTIEHKQRVVDHNWDRMFAQLVQNYAIQMMDNSSYIQKMLQELDIHDI